MNAFRFALFHLVFDVYMFFILKALFKDQRSIWIFSILYFLASAFTYFSFYKLGQVIQTKSMFKGSEANLYIGIIITSLFTKMVFTGLVFMQDIFRLLIGAGRWIAGFFSDEKVIKASYIPGRRNFLTFAAAGIAAIPFTALIYGLSIGKYRYTLEKLKLSFFDLPENFHNFKIVQISDIHAGSFDSREQVMKGIQMVNDQNPDIIVFTGDLVNSNKDEIDPYIDLFAKLKAKRGKYAILGNHDYYGTYDLESQAEKEVYWDSFLEKYKTLGFDLLQNEHRDIEIDGQKISLIGVENWGAGRWFPKHGDLDIAMPANDSFRILLSHDPTHWNEKVLKHKKHIHLTLSGHTHGFQFGINYPGFKWSPAQYRYKHWMGLYEEKNQYLYVNRGFGFLGFPGRVGMWPEVAVIELISKLA